MGKRANNKRAYKDAPVARRNGVAALAEAEDKEPWACSECFPKFAAQGKHDKDHFISGSRASASLKLKAKLPTNSSAKICELHRHLCQGLGTTGGLTVKQIPKKSEWPRKF